MTLVQSNLKICVLKNKWTKGGFSTGKKENSCSVRDLSIVVGFDIFFVSYGNQPFWNWHSSSFVQLDIELHDE